MPLVLRIDRYYIFFWTNEGTPPEPIHVHIPEGRPTLNATKIWISQTGHCCLCSNSSRIPERALRNIMRILEAYHEEIAQKWMKYFGEIWFILVESNTKKQTIKTINKGEQNLSCLLSPRFCPPYI